jgi:hypothetical protein
MLANCEVVITNDRDWHQRLNRQFPQFRWIYLSA